MKITLPLQSHFLRQTFSETRSLLLGQLEYAGAGIEEFETFVSPQVVEPSRPSFKISFTLAPLKPMTIKILRWVLTGVFLLSVAVAVIMFVPQVYYRVFPADTTPVQATETGTPRGGSFDSGAQVETQEKIVLPPQDTSLPEGTWVVIPRIGVRTQIDSSLTADEALAKGVWMAPEYGSAGDKTKPVILAAHRYGWKWWWKSDYWKYNSFYLLPDLQPGDMVELIHDQRKYYYEIYAGEEGEEISDYSADMILYTCKLLNSPIRHFRYARLVDMAKDTQQG